MKSHASMNRIYRLVWNAALSLWVAVAENAKGRGKGGSARGSVQWDDVQAEGGDGGGAGFRLNSACRAAMVLLASLAMLTHEARAADAANASVSAGAAGISTAGNTTTINQSTQRVAIDWTSLSTAANEALRFNQPNAQAIALNRITGSSPSELLGSLTANGQVFILNPNGVLFGAGSQVNVGGLVASTLNMSNADFMAGNHVFTGSGGSGSVVNQGTLNAAPGGYLALLAPEVRNEGVMTASLGTALLAAGNKVTLNLDNGSLLGYSIDQGAINALAENRQLIRADGGQVLLGAKALDSLTSAAVNNTGIVEAKTIAGKAGRILLMGDMETGTVHVGGTLDASASNGGDGGFIETSAAHVKVAPGTRITTQAPQGKTGKWLIDPQDYTIAASGGDITGADLSAQLDTTDIEIQSASGSTSGIGDINVNDAVSWSANKLTLTAERDVNVNAVMTATGSASLAVNTGASGYLNMKMDAAGNFTGRVDLDTTGTLHINGEQYTIITSVGDKESTTGTDLSGMRANLNGRYVLGKNVNFDDVTPVDIWGWDNMDLIFTGTAYSRGMFAIGSQATPFTGKFEGLGHTILNPKVGPHLLPGSQNGLWVMASNEGVGIFGVTGVGAVVSNVAVAAPNDFVVNFYALQTDTPLANYQAEFTGGIGALVGENGGLIRNASVNLSLGVANNNAASGGVGAVAGANNGTVTGSRASVASLDGQPFVGGLVGRNRGLIDDSHADFTSISTSYYGVGGLVGWNETGATIQNSSSSGLVNGSQEIGGLVGRNAGAILDSSSSASVIGQMAGGLVGRLYDGSISRSHASGDVADNTSIPVDLQRYVPGVGMVNDFQGLSLGIGGLVGTMSEPVESSPSAFLWGHGSIADSYATGNVRGTVSNGTGATENAGGLLGSGFDNQGSIVRSYATGNVTLGYSGGRAGGFVGSIDSFLTPDRNYATGNVSGPIDQDFGVEYWLGGFVGRGFGRITNAYSTGNVTGNYTIGGFAGFAYLVENAYATGNVTSGSLPPTGISAGYVRGGFAGQIIEAVNTYATGTVSGGRNSDPQGGWAASPCLSCSSNFSNNYYNVTANPALGDLVATGLTTTQLKQASSFAGFDIANTGGSSAVWRIYEGQTTPLLRSFLTPLNLADAPNATQTYNGTTQTAAATAMVDANLLGTAASGRNAGLYNGYYSTQQGYDISGGNLTITAANLVLTTANVSKTYNGQLDAAGVFTATGGTQLFDTDTATGGSFAFLDKNAGTGKTVTVGGATLNDGNGGGNYNVSYADNTSSMIAAKALTYSTAAANKTYDGDNTATATLSGLTGLVGTETVTASAGATFNTKDVATANLVTVNSVTLADGSNGGLASNYSIAAGGTAVANITAKALTYSTTAANKTYDGDTTASASLNLIGLVNTETLGSTAGATFNTKDVATANLVTVNSATLADGSNGGLASNYSIAAGGTAAANITAKALTYSTAAANKTYDGNATAAATLSGLTGLVGTETVTASAGATFNTKDVATANLVTVNSATLADGSNGGLASNYSIAAGGTAAANITAKALTYSTTAANKTYDGDNTATATLSGLTGLVGTETVTASAGATFNSKDVATANLVTVNSATLADGSNGGLASNYSIAAGGTAAANITAKALTYTTTASNKTYDGDNTASASLNLMGLVNTETLGSTAGATFNTKDVATANLVTVNSATLANGTNGGLASNYSIAAGGTAAASITAKALTYSTAAANKTYDGDNTATATLSGLTGLVGTETVTASAGATFNTKDVATANLVTVNSVTLADGSNGGLASNYSIAAGGTAVANITAKALTYSTTAANKTYEGDNTATATLSGLTGLVGTETVTASAGATFNTKDVLTANLVTVNSATLADGSNGGLASNYSIAAGGTAAANITAKALTYSTTAANKTYDGNATATATLSGLTGLVGTETVAANGTATFNSKDVLAANTVTVNSATLADGANGGLASNYSIAAGGTAAAAITAKALAYSTTASNKEYDGSTGATATISGLTGLVGVETVSVAGNAATFNSKDVLAANLVTVNSATLADGSNGGLASNYSVAAGGTAAANITAKALTYSTAAANKTYDGNTTATATLSGLTGLVGTETVNANGTATFNSKDVATANLVTVNSATLADGSNGGLASNYSIAAGGTAGANITARDLTVTAAGVNKVYDGTTVATVGYADNRVAGDVLGITGVASFADKNAGTGKAVSVNGISTSGTDAGNYNLLNTTASTTASITPKALTVTANGDTKLYDGSAYRGGNGVSYNGFVAGDTVTDIGGALAYGGSSQGAVAAGDYLITPGGLNSISGNYALGFVDGALSITTSNASTAALGNAGLASSYDAALQAVAGLSGSSGGGGGADSGGSASADALAAAAAEADNTEEK